METEITWNDSVNGRTEGIAKSGRRYLYFLSQINNRWEMWEDSYGEIPWMAFNDQQAQSVCERWEKMKIGSHVRMTSPESRFTEDFLEPSDISAKEAFEVWHPITLQKILAAMEENVEIVGHVGFDVFSSKILFPTEKEMKHFYAPQMRSFLIAEISEMVKNGLSKLDRIKNIRNKDGN